jgi:hypothetical protein
MNRIINSIAIKNHDPPAVPAGENLTENQARRVSTIIRIKVRLTKEYVGS